VNDYLNVVRYYNLHADKLKDVDKLLLSDLKGTSSSVFVSSSSLILRNNMALLQYTH
jgi:hypothetical protein